MTRKQGVDYNVCADAFVGENLTRCGKLLGESSFLMRIEEREDIKQPNVNMLIVVMNDRTVTQGIIEFRLRGLPNPAQ